MASSEETYRAGVALGGRLGSGARVLLVGPLGAGKTTFAKGVAAALGVREQVTSPTFTLVHDLPGRSGSVWHADLYRIEDPRELEEVGFLEIWDSGDVVLVEWGDRLPRALQREATHRVELRMQGDGRRLAIRAPRPGRRRRPVT